MARFDDIHAAACKRKGAHAVAARLPTPKTAMELQAVPDHRYLSEMSRRVFQAGLKHAMVDAKWPVFEDVFFGFDPRRVRAMSDEDFDRLMADRRLIRHGPKMRAALRNAAALCDLADAGSSFGAYLADWPGDATVELWDDIKRRFAQLGGNSGPYLLRRVGKDTFILSPDVQRALARWAGVADAARSKRARRAAQDAFNAWAAESARPLCQISMILALSTGE